MELKTTIQKSRHWFFFFFWWQHTVIIYLPFDYEKNSKTDLSSQMKLLLSHTFQHKQSIRQ